MKIQLLNRPVLRQLPDGLILVRSCASDADALAEFNSRIHSDSGFDRPDDRVGAWTHDLLACPHPTFHPDDFTLVVESSSGRIVSSLNLISQKWAYDGIPFEMGRPELVGTLPEYRNRGLVRAQFEEIHRWSVERGQLVQGITGIPYYYKLFGYEMGLELGGGRVGYEAQLPVLPEGESDPFDIRPATVDDIPFISEVYTAACKRYLVNCVRNDSVWLYDLTGQGPKNVERFEYCILTRVTTNERVGYFTHPWFTWDHGLVANHYELMPGVSWLEATPAVMRYLWRTGALYWQKEGKPGSPKQYGLWFGSEHPAYNLFQERLPRIREPYAWYIRVPDLPGFIQHIAPILEQRIADSAIVGYCGDVKISFYRSGLKLRFEKGRLKASEAWQPGPDDRGSAAFPDLSFLQLVFGYRTFEELAHSYADCSYNGDEERVLLNTLFPRKASSLMFVN